MRGLDEGVEPDVVARAPQPGLAADLVVDRAGVGPVHAERWQVEVDDRLPGSVRVEVDHDDDDVGRLAVGTDGVLAEGQDVVALGAVEAQVAQLVERRVRGPDRVEPGEVGRQADAVGLGLGPVARAQLVLLRVEVLLGARAYGDVLEQLEAGVDAPGRRQHRGEHGADLEQTN